MLIFCEVNDWTTLIFTWLYVVLIIIVSTTRKKDTCCQCMVAGWTSSDSIEFLVKVFLLLLVCVSLLQVQLLTRDSTQKRASIYTSVPSSKNIELSICASINSWYLNEMIWNSPAYSKIKKISWYIFQFPKHYKKVYIVHIKLAKYRW